jgi:hypothetical protein
VWLAPNSRHSERTADLPRRKKRSKRRLNFNKTWVFGEEFALTADDESLTTVLQRT